MKIETFDTTLIYDIVNHMRKKGMPDVMGGYLRFLLEDNIPMTIRIDNKLYKAPYRFWQAFVQAHGSCCGCCDADSLHDVDVARKALLENSIHVTDQAIDY